MATITIQFDDKTKLDKILNFIKRLNVPFHILDPQSDLEIQWDNNANTIIQSRLTEKYIKNGEWDKMDDEARQDASLLERMLYLEETKQTEPLTLEENTAFANEMKTWLKKKSVTLVKIL